MYSFYSRYPILGIAGVTEGVELSADLENQFALKKYEAEVAQEDGTDKLMEIDEVNAMKLLMGSQLQVIQIIFIFRQMEFPHII